MHEPIDLDAVLATVGPALKVQYNKPHCYPMAAPTFANRPRIERQRPDGPHAIYVHIPFCNYQCSFCTYATRQGGTIAQMRRYVQALQAESEWIQPGASITELYVGGGTPTVLPPALLGEVLSSVTQRTRSLPNAVNTVECSPESATPQHIEVLQRHSINRISMGIQTLDDFVLSRLNRHHSGQDALAACQMLVDGGMATNVDLIFGLPGQTEESFARDFDAVASCGVHSVTVYNLRINERTPVAGILEDEEQLHLQRLVKWRASVNATAARLGFTQTRWHTFVRQDPASATHQVAPGVEDTRNQGVEFGIGQSARSRLGSNVYRNHTDFNAYLERVEAKESPVQEVFELTVEEQKTLFIGKSLGDGRPLDRNAYVESFGCAVEEDYSPQLERLAECGLIEQSPQYISLTFTGKLVFDLVTWMFYPQHSQDWIAGRQAVRLTKKRFKVASNSV